MLQPSDASGVTTKVLPVVYYIFRSVAINNGDYMVMNIMVMKIKHPYDIKM